MNLNGLTYAQVDLGEAEIAVAVRIEGIEQRFPFLKERRGEERRREETRGEEERDVCVLAKVHSTQQHSSTA